MGWSGTWNVPSDRKAYCRAEFGPNYEVLKDAMVGSTYYAAVKHLRPEWNGQVFCAVTLTKIGTYQGQREFLTKGLDESCGPTEAKCPVGILDLLSPLDDESDRNGYARAWRQRCRDHHAARREASSKAGKFVDGEVYYLAKPVRFSDGSERNRFTVSHRYGRTRRGQTKNKVLRFLDDRGTVVQLSRRMLPLLMTEADYRRQLENSARSSAVANEATMPAMF